LKWKSFTMLGFFHPIGKGFVHLCPSYFYLFSSKNTPPPPPAPYNIACINIPFTWKLPV
jgi:hypothetical protein